MSAQPAGVFCAGTEPPPDSTEPRPRSAIWVGDCSPSRSAWVIWPIFSARVIRPSRSSTRSAVGLVASRYGAPTALRTTCGLVPTAAPAAVRSTRTVRASSTAAVACVTTSMLCVVPDSVPAGNVSVPENAS